MPFGCRTIFRDRGTSSAYKRLTCTRTTHVGLVILALPALLEATSIQMLVVLVVPVIQAPLVALTVQVPRVVIQVPRKLMPPVSAQVLTCGMLGVQVALVHTSRPLHLDAVRMLTKPTPLPVLRHVANRTGRTGAVGKPGASRSGPACSKHRTSPISTPGMPRGIRTRISRMFSTFPRRRSARLG